MIFLRAILFFLLLIFNSTALAMPPIMPLSEVQHGMYGTGYTVVESSGELEPFNVKIIGTIQNGKGSASYIMAEASGDLMRRTGGVLQGMSGSPIYINGRLIGALSAGFKEMNPYTFLITPIENMTDIWNFPDAFAVKPPAADEENIENENLQNVVSQEEIFDKEEIFTETADEEKSVFIYNGFDSAGLNYLQNAIPSFKNLTPAAADTAPAIRYDASLYGGAPFGVAVVCGDFVVGATGTVTAVDENKILGFGHSFTHAGNTNFFMTDANVIGPVSGAGGGMKVASLGDIIGRINQDRESGVGGILGQFPSVVPISVTVNDTNYNALMAYNESLMAKLGAAITYSALSKHADSLAECTVKIKFDIKTNVVNGGVFSRENIYYSPADVGQLAVTELLSALTLITSNTVTESNLYGIDVNIEYEMARQTASLVKAEPIQKLVKPGEIVDLRIILQPYRKPAEEIFVKYTVPITAREGNFVLDLHGGGLVPVTQVQQAGVIVPSTKSPAELYNERLAALLRTNKNNEIIIKPAAVAKTEKELKEDIKRARKILAQYEKLGKKLPAVQPPAKIPTNYIIDNVVQCTLKIDKL